MKLEKLVQVIEPATDAPYINAAANGATEDYVYFKFGEFPNRVQWNLYNWIEIGP